VSSETFTAEQIEAIEKREVAFALAANAGSGKTSVLVERFVRDVTVDGIPPGRILAITFTDRAAGELRARVRRGLIDAGHRDAAHDSASAFISTFHGFCTRVLRAHPLLAGLAPDFAVLDDTATASLRGQGFQLALSDWMTRPGALEIAAAFGVDRLADAVLAVFDEQRSRGVMTPRLPQPRPGDDLVRARSRLADACTEIAKTLDVPEPIATVAKALSTLERCAELLAADTPPDPSQLAALRITGNAQALKTPAAEAFEAARDDYAHAVTDQLGATAVLLLDELLAAFGVRFAALKRARGGADFDDLELRAAALLGEHADVATFWRERFDRLMVDELQDTNARQMAILAILDRDNLFTVGDEFQSIYAFRHADVAIFRDRFASLYQRESAGVLSANFRSRASILDAVNAVFAPLFGSRFVPLLAGRQDAAGGMPVEVLISDGGGWEEHEELLGPELAPAPLWRRAEARLLAQRIDELIRSGEARAGEIVVLLRAATDIRVFESAIADLGHVTLAGAGEGFYGRPEVADLAAYVQVLANPLDELALFGVLASPLCGASADALVALKLQAREAHVTCWEVLRGEPADLPLGQFARRVERARRAAHSSSLAEMLARAVREHGYELYLCQLHSPERRVANVHKLLRLARDFERREGRDLRRFADAFSAGQLGALREPEAPPPIADAVRLMTIHQAKGLEFPVVCLADLGRGPNNSQPALLTDEDRVGLCLSTLDNGPIHTLDYVELVEERKRAGTAEEQRVFYVAMTRARERLIISGAASFGNWPRAEKCAIAWLAPALVPDLIDRAAQGGTVATVVAGTDGVPIRLMLSSADTVGSVLAGAPSQPPESAVARPVVPADLAAPARRPPDLGRLSYTALAEYERCGYRYYLQRVIGLPDAPNPPGQAVEHGIGAASRGVVVHAILEKLDFTAPQPAQRAEIEAAALSAGLALESDEDRSEIAALADAFAMSPLLGRLASCRDIRREEAFAFTLEHGELLRGFIDVCAIAPDGTLLVVDYKTDRLDHDADLAAHIDRDYAVQRLVYALAGLQSGVPAVEIAYCFLRAPEDVVSTRYTAGERSLLEADLRERLAALRSGRFDVTLNPGRDRCASCPGRVQLCSYEESITLGTQGVEQPSQTRLDI
jgi:ATP-dependent helicase/nuclease subunit A